MIAMKNPFYFKELSINAPFCNRRKELKDLLSYADSKANVLLYSPRRFGKTSLIKRVQFGLAKKGAVIAFADFFGVVSVEDVAARLARAVFEFARPQEGLFKKAIKIIKTFRPVIKPNEMGEVAISVEPMITKNGFDILEETLLSLENYIDESNTLVNVALDEFQEIVDLQESLKIEGIMRTHIQKHKASYFFIGSRRRILLGIFNERQRPFFQSAINYELKSLPADELAVFIAELFIKAGKQCELPIAKSIASSVSCHPYYSQKLAFFVFEISGARVASKDVQSAENTLIDSEIPVFEAILQGLAPQQIALLKAIAKEPSDKLYAMPYMKVHGLSSTGGVQGAVKRLATLDLVDSNENKMWRVVDPIFEKWLRRS